MNLAKITNLIAGLLLMACGVAACFLPDSVAAYYGFSFDEVQAKTTLRVIGGFFIGVAYLFVYFALRLSNQQPLLYALCILLASFALSRIISIWIDGVVQVGMWYELSFELVSLVLVIMVYIKGRGEEGRKRTAKEA
jgi:hypothetical protein